MARIIARKQNNSINSGRLINRSIENPKNFSFSDRPWWVFFFFFFVIVVSNVLHELLFLPISFGFEGFLSCNCFSFNSNSHYRAMATYLIDHKKIIFKFPNCKYNLRTNRNSKNSNTNWLKKIGNLLIFLGRRLFVNLCYLRYVILSHWMDADWSKRHHTVMFRKVIN